MQQKNHRNEIKQILTNEEYLILSSRIGAFLEKDPNVKTAPYYVSSLYFDDVHSTSLNEKLAGEPDRKKFRIRIYNNSDEYIKLECKEKRASRINKRAVRINREIYNAIFDGDYQVLAQLKDPVADEMLALVKTKKLEKSVIVNYERLAFVHPLSATRITFDTNLSVPVNTLDLLESQENLHIFPQNETILEIKYNEFIPQYITMLLNSYAIQSAASKFVLCREFLSSANISLKG